MRWTRSSRRMSVPELRRWCERLDPARAHLGRTQLLRAIAVALLSGAPISRVARARAPRGGTSARYLVVDPGAELPARLDQRFDAMLDSGLGERSRYARAHGSCQRAGVERHGVRWLRWRPCRGNVRARKRRAARAHRDAPVRQAAAHLVSAPATSLARYVASILARRMRSSARCAGGARPTTEECWREDRHHLLSDIRRLRRGRDGARHRARGARARSPLHHVSAAVSASRIHAAASSSTKWTSFAIRCSSIRRTTSRSRCDARGRARSRARAGARALRDPARHERVDRTRDARGFGELGADHHDVARHGHHARSGRTRPFARSRNSRSSAPTASPPFRSICGARRSPPSAAISARWR